MDSWAQRRGVNVSMTLRQFSVRSHMWSRGAGCQSILKHIKLKIVISLHLDYTPCFKKTSLRFLVNACANVNGFQNSFTGKLPRKFLFISDRDFHVASIALLNYLVKFENSKPPNLCSYHQNLFTGNLTNNIQIIHATKMSQ